MIPFCEAADVVASDRIKAAVVLRMRVAVENLPVVQQQSNGSSSAKVRVFEETAENAEPHRTLDHSCKMPVRGRDPASEGQSLAPGDGRVAIVAADLKSGTLRFLTNSESLADLGICRAW